MQHQLRHPGQRRQRMRTSQPTRGRGIRLMLKLGRHRDRAKLHHHHRRQRLVVQRPQRDSLDRVRHHPSGEHQHHTHQQRLLWTGDKGRPEGQPVLRHPRPRKRPQWTMDPRQHPVHPNQHRERCTCLSQILCRNPLEMSRTSWRSSIELRLRRMIRNFQCGRLFFGIVIRKRVIRVNRAPKGYPSTITSRRWPQRWRNLLFFKISSTQPPTTSCGLWENRCPSQWRLVSKIS